MDVFAWYIPYRAPPFQTGFYFILFFNGALWILYFFPHYINKNSYRKHILLLHLDCSLRPSNLSFPSDSLQCFFKRTCSSTLPSLPSAMHTALSLFHRKIHCVGKMAGQESLCCNPLPCHVEQFQPETAGRFAKNGN